jgi:hypothetical protein
MRLSLPLPYDCAAPLSEFADEVLWATVVMGALPVWAPFIDGAGESPNGAPKEKLPSYAMSASFAVHAKARQNPPYM